MFKLSQTFHAPGLLRQLQPWSEVLQQNLLPRLRVKLHICTIYSQSSLLYSSSLRESIHKICSKYLANSELEDWALEKISAPKSSCFILTKIECISEKAFFQAYNLQILCISMQSVSVRCWNKASNCTI